MSDNKKKEKLTCVEESLYIGSIIEKSKAFKIISPTKSKITQIYDKFRYFL